MLQIARRNPVLRGEIKAARIDLIQGDISRMAFRERSFDFVYSVGVLGDYAPPSLSLLQLIRQWLKEGGSAFLTIMDGAPYRKSWKERIATAVYPLLPRATKVYVDVKLDDYMMNWHDCEALLRQAGFGHFEINRQVQRRRFLFITARK
jgi:SAM-dependent methyltransferase